MLLYFRYSKGFGLVQYLVGRESFLNLPNCLVGIVFYSTQLALGKTNVAGFTICQSKNEKEKIMENNSSQIDGSAQDCSVSCAYAMEMLQSCATKSIGKIDYINTWVNNIAPTKQSMTEPHVYDIGYNISIC